MGVRERMPDAAALAQRAVDRLSDDESLRGDLTDEGFAPLFDWAVSRAMAAAATAAAQPEEQAAATMEAATAALREIVRAAVDAATRRDTSDLLAAAGAAPPALLDASRAPAALVGVALGDDAAGNARALAEALSALPPPQIAARPASDEPTLAAIPPSIEPAPVVAPGDAEATATLEASPPAEPSVAPEASPAAAQATHHAGAGDRPVEAARAAAKRWLRGTKRWGRVLAGYVKSARRAASAAEDGSD